MKSSGYWSRRRRTCADTRFRWRGNDTFRRNFASSWREWPRPGPGIPMRLRRTNRARIIGTAADRTVRYGPPFRVPGRRRFPWRRWRTGPASHRRPSVRRRRWSAARNRRRRSGARACVTGRRRSRRAWRTRRTGRPRRPPPVHRRRRAAHRGRRTTTQWRAATYRWGGGRARTTSSTVRRWCRRSVDVEGLVAAVAPLFVNEILLSSLQTIFCLFSSKIFQKFSQNT